MTMVTFGCVRLGGRLGDLTTLLPFPEQVQKAAMLSNTLHCWESYLGGVAQAGYSKPFNGERPCWYDLSAQHPSTVLYIVLFNEVSEVFITFFFLCFPDYTLEFSRQQ